MNLKELGMKKKEIQELVINRLFEYFIDEEKFLYKAKDIIPKLITERAYKLIDKHLEKTVEDLLNGEFRAVDSWGYAKGEKTTLKDMIKNRADAYLEQKVSRDYGTPSYNGDIRRIEYLVIKRCSETVDLEFKKKINEEISKAKDMITKNVATYIAETIIKR